MRRLLPIVGALGLSGWLAIPGSVSALPAASVSLSASPNPSVTTSTFKIVIRLSAPASNVHFHLEKSGGFDTLGSCSPVAHCTISGAARNPYWTYVSASGTLTATFTVTVHPSDIVRFYSDGGISVTNPPSIQMKSPTVTTTLTRSPTGVVMPGDTIHVTATTKTNAGPLINGQFVVLPTTGVSMPTNLSAGAMYEAWGAVDQNATLNPSATLSFDLVVTAVVGTKLTFKGYFQAYDPGRSMSFTVGVAPTPRPTATPKATRTPTKPPSAAPSASIAASASSIPSTPGPSTNASAGPSPSPTLEPTSVPVQATPAATAPPETVPANDSVGGAFFAGLAIVLVGGLAVIGALRLRLGRAGRR